jgi:predicted NAD-dependent protein-ADP-ribosyltransferase YbiA (DUF1768 family)
LNGLESRPGKCHNPFVCRVYTATPIMAPALSVKAPGPGRATSRRQPGFVVLCVTPCLLLVLAACDSTKHASVATRPSQADARYPSQWWKAVPKEGAPAWEILPQEAGPGEVILSKRNELGLLSNFAATPFTFHSQRYASLEGFWQMMKYPEGPDDPRASYPGLHWAFTRQQVAQMTGFEAKRAGTLGEDHMRRMGISWVSFEGRRFEYKPATPGEHYWLIVAATREKVSQNPKVRRVLLATDNLVLKPDHHQEPNAPAAWRYYEILMQIRAELQRQR